MKKFSDKVYKNIKNQIQSNSFGWPFIEYFISSDWFTCNSHSLFKCAEILFCKQEEFESAIDEYDQFFPSFISWDEFIEFLSSSFSFKENDYENVALFLRHIGAINHYRDVNYDEEIRQLVILHPKK